MMAQQAKQRQHIKCEPPVSVPFHFEPPEPHSTPTNTQAVPQLFTSPPTPSGTPTPPTPSHLRSTTQFVPPPTESPQNDPPKPLIFRSSTAPKARFKQRKRKKARGSLYSGPRLVDNQGFTWYRCFGDYECGCRRGWKSAFTWFPDCKKRRLYKL
jgi:hypothetical protein